MEKLNGVVDLSKYKNNLRLKNKVGRFIWNIVYLFFFRPFSLPVFNGWRVFILKIFGAKIGKGSIVYASAKIWAPWNLVLGEFVAIAGDVDCYNVDEIRIHSNTTISQYAYLCSASHDIYDPANPLITAPIEIMDQAWVAAGAFINMGVVVGQGAVVGARASVFKNVEPWTIVGGNPAKFIKERKFDENK